MFDAFVAMQIARQATEDQFGFEEAPDRRARVRRRGRERVRGASLVQRLLAGRRETCGSSELRRADAR